MAPATCPPSLPNDMSPSQKCRLAVLLCLLCFPPPTRAEQPHAGQVVSALDSLGQTIAAELTARLDTNAVHGSYTTVWRQFEGMVITALDEILPRHLPGLTATNFVSGEAGREKNRPADFAIVCGTNTIEISIKSARLSGQPENDMGTFRDYENRKRLFAAAFTVWVRYEDDGGTLRAERVFFDRSWRFTGKSTLVDGVKYRKKDGNMRPKSWAMFDSGKAFWKTEEEFDAAVKRSETFRANELVKEYIGELSEEDQRLLHDRLHEKFEKPGTNTNGHQ
jgi:hypothetical protein